MVVSTLSCSVRKKYACNCPAYHTTACPATRPNSAINTSFRLGQRPNASASGLRDAPPARLSCTNGGDSRRLKRTHTPIASSSADSRNGMRQPQAANAASPSAARTPTTSASASSRPSDAVVWIQPV